MNGYNFADLFADSNLLILKVFMLSLLPPSKAFDLKTSINDLDFKTSIDENLELEPVLPEDVLFLIFSNIFRENQPKETFHLKTVSKSIYDIALQFYQLYPFKQLNINTPELAIDYLKNHKNFKQIDISNISFYYPEKLSNVVKDLSDLRKIKAYNCQLVSKFAETLVIFTNITSLNLEKNHMIWTGVKTIATALTNLTFLNFGANSLGKLGAQAIASNLTNLQTSILRLPFLDPKAEKPLLPTLQILQTLNF